MCIVCDVGDETWDFARSCVVRERVHYYSGMTDCMYICSHSVRELLLELFYTSTKNLSTKTRCLQGFSNIKCNCRNISTAL
jgi:hypothetical protein